MFKKIIIADDLVSINKGILTLTDNLKIDTVQSEQYCDTVYLKIKKALLNNNPYELLITDLSFNADHRERKYTSGEELIKALMEVQPDLKVIVYSVEDKLQKVRTLINSYHVNAFVCKGRKGLVELEQAIHSVYDGKQFLSQQVVQALSSKQDFEINDYDIVLLKLLSNGLLQDEISLKLKENNIAPNSLSSIEKHLNKLKIQFKASNATHLVAIVKDLGLI